MFFSECELKKALRDTRAAWYGLLSIPPSANAAFTGLLEEMLSHSDCKNSFTVVLGDLNFDLLEIPRPSATKNYLNLFQTLGFEQLITKATRPISNSLLDHIFVSQKYFVTDSGTLPLSLSDHLPIFVSLNSRSNIFKQPGHKTLHIRSHKSLSIDAFIDDLSCAPWSTLEVYKVVHMIRSAKRVFYRNAIKSNLDNSKNVWRIIRNISPVKCSNLPGHLSVNGHIVSDNTEIANQFNGHFANITSSVDLGDAPLYPNWDYISEFVASKLPSSAPLFTIPPISEQDVESSLSRLKSNKAVGLDGVDGYFLKIAASAISNSLTTVFKHLLWGVPGCLESCQGYAIVQGGLPSGPLKFSPNFCTCYCFKDS